METNDLSDNSSSVRRYPLWWITLFIGSAIYTYGRFYFENTPLGLFGVAFFGAFMATFWIPVVVANFLSILSGRKIAGKSYLVALTIILILWCYFEYAGSLSLKDR